MIPTVSSWPGPGVHRSLEAMREGRRFAGLVSRASAVAILVDDELPSDQIQAEGKGRGVLVTCDPDSIERARQVAGGGQGANDPGRRCTVPLW